MAVVGSFLADLYLSRSQTKARLKSAFVTGTYEAKGAVASSCSPLKSDSAWITA